MTTFAEAGAAIRAAFAAGFTDHPIAADNTFYEPPRDGAGDPTPYVALHILEGGAVRVGHRSAGQGVHRHPGVVKVQIFVPTGEGTADDDARAIGDAVAAVFRNTETSGVRFFTPSYRTVGVDDRGYWQAGVSIPFEYDLIA